MQKKGTLFITVMVLFFFFVSLSLFAGGRQEDTSKEKGNTTAVREKEVNLTFVETQPTEYKTKLTKDIIGEFEGKNPAIKVEFQSMPNTEAKSKLLVMAAGGTLPDVIEMNDSWLGPLGAGGHLLDMEPYVDQWEHKDNLVDAVFALGKSLHDKMYWIPYGLWGVAVYYNTSMLEEAGVEPPTTMEEFHQVGSAITNEDEGQYGYAFRGGVYGGTHAVMWMLGHVGQPDYFDENGNCVFDTPKAIEGLEAYNRLYQEVSPPDSTNWGFSECVDSFTSGVTGLLIQSNEVVQICNEKMGEGEFDTTLLPTGPSGNAYDTSGQTGYAMAANSENKDEAWELVSYLNAPEINLRYCKALGFSPIFKSIEDPAFTQGPIKVYHDQLQSKNHFYAKNPSYLEEWSEFIVDLATAEGQEMILGKQTPAETARAWADFLDEAYNRWKSGQ